MREIACDESGADGENLVGGNTLFFAHGSVDVPVESAAGIIEEIRGRIRSPAEEYKANHLLREKHRAVLEWLLGELCGSAHVVLVHKESFLVERVVEVLGGTPGDAVALSREEFGAREWTAFLRAANRLLRVRADVDSPVLVSEFFGTLDTLRRTATSVFPAHLTDRREKAYAYRAGIPALIPLLDPLFPAIVTTAAHWSADAAPVHLVHDRQTLLTPARIEWLRERAPALAGMRLVQARSDPRVQLADFLAGIARKIAGDEISGAGDPVLGELLRPYLGSNDLKNAIT
ncbi:hypothetical protein ABZX85_43165 [Streptomyces sp. NPDC004539]|uniref:hypothetical protein n=1 Tax=Streptomyces sp. NPDC004539 TaxID=3154280 RepID=UPI0033AD3659